MCKVKHSFTSYVMLCTTDMQNKLTEVRLFTSKGLITNAAKKDPYIWMFVIEAVQRALRFPCGVRLLINGDAYRFNGNGEYYNECSMVHGNLYVDGAKPYLAIELSQFDYNGECDARGLADLRERGLTPLAGYPGVYEYTPAVI